MALLFFDGFETIGTETGIGDQATTRARAIMRYDKVNNGSVSESSNGYLMDDRNASGKFAWNLGLNEGNWVQAAFPSAETAKTWVVGFIVHTPDTATSEMYLFRAVSDLITSANHFSVMLNEDGDIIVRSSSDLTDFGSAPAVMTRGSWNHVEVKFTVDTYTGSVEVKVDGTQVLDLTSIDTRGSSDDVEGGVFGGFVSVGSKPDDTADNFAAVDDIYMINTDAGGPDDFLGRKAEVISLPPAADTLVQQWDTNSSGAVHYTLIDENGADSSDVIRSGTNLQEDLFDTTDISDGGEVFAVKVEVEALAVVDITHSIDVVCKSVSAYSQTNHTVDDKLNYTVHTHYQTADPNTSSAWTNAGVDAMVVGVKFNT